MTSLQELENRQNADGFITKHRRKSRRQKKKQSIVIEETPWISKEKKIPTKKDLELNSKNFPTMNTNNSLNHADTTLQYNVKDLFKKKKIKKEKDDKIKPGWIRLYYENGKVQTEYGKRLPLIYDVEKELSKIRILKMIERHEMYKQYDNFDEYIPYWKTEDLINYDDYEDDESEEYISEEYYSDSE